MPLKSKALQKVKIQETSSEETEQDLTIRNILKMNDRPSGRIEKRAPHLRIIRTVLNQRLLSRERKKESERAASAATELNVQ